MSTSSEGEQVVMVHGIQSTDATAQTRGMERTPGIDKTSAGASKIWLGHVTAVPNTMSAPHHHGDAETAVYVLKGRVRIYFGEDLKRFVEAGPGDYLFVPANTPHIEGNPYDEPAEAIVSRSPDNIVVNLGE
jgi:uncharacterized RmlC-like cupin family protein